MNIGVIIENNKLSSTTRIILNDLFNENLFKIYLINIEFEEEKKKRSFFKIKYLSIAESILNLFLKALNFKSQIHHFEFLGFNSNNFIAIDSNYYSIKS